MGSKLNDKSLYKSHTEGDSQREEETKQRQRKKLMKPQAKEYLEPTKAGKGKEAVSLRAIGRSMSLLTS